MQAKADLTARYLRRCAANDMTPLDEDGFTRDEAAVNELAARLFVTVWVGHVDRLVVQALAQQSFDAAEAFFDERDRRCGE